MRGQGLWLATEPVLSAFGQRRNKALQAYEEWVAAGRDQPSPWAQLKNQVYLGSDAFVQKLQCKLDARQDLSEVPAAQRRPALKPLANFERKHPQRDEAIVQAYAGGGYAMKDIGEHFGLHYSRVSRIIAGKDRERERAKGKP